MKTAKYRRTTLKCSASFLTHDLYPIPTPPAVAPMLIPSNDAQPPTSLVGLAKVIHENLPTEHYDDNVCFISANSFCFRVKCPCNPTNSLKQLQQTQMKTSTQVLNKRPCLKALIRGKKK